MNELSTWLPIIMSAGSIIVAIAVVMTRKDSSLHEKIRVSETRAEEQVKTIFASLERIEKSMSNHIAHNDEKLNVITECITRIDKELYSHLQNTKNG